ncbi:hypothetical protein YC2023_094181 [Brassica napus]
MQTPCFYVLLQRSAFLCLRELYISVSIACLRFLHHYGLTMELVKREALSQNVHVSSWSLWWLWGSWLGYMASRGLCVGHGLASLGSEPEKSGGVYQSPVSPVFGLSKNV